MRKTLLFIFSYLFSPIFTGDIFANRKKLMADRQMERMRRTTMPAGIVKTTGDPVR
jgi:hypothetical protein